MDLSLALQLLQLVVSVIALIVAIEQLKSR